MTMLSDINVPQVFAGLIAGVLMFAMLVGLWISEFGDGASENGP
jgi:hypothetical protein